MKPSERYRQIKASIPNRYLGIKEPFITERALLELLDELHPEAKGPACVVCGSQGTVETDSGQRCELHVYAHKPAGPPPLPPLPPLAKPKQE